MPSSKQKTDPFLKTYIALVMTFVAVLCAALLAYLPFWHLSEGLPLIPAIIFGEAALAGLASSLYGLDSIILGGRFTKPRKKGADELIRIDKPWLSNPQWAAKRLTYSKLEAVPYLWFFALNWWMIIAFLFVDMGSKLLNQSWIEQALVLIFPTLGLVSLWVAAKNTLHWWLYRRATLLFDTLPGRPGYSFKATALTNLSQKPQHPFRVTLIGYKQTWMNQELGDPIGNRALETFIEEISFTVEPHEIQPENMHINGGATTMDIKLDIPSDAPSSGTIDNTTDIIWEIQIESTHPTDGDFKALFAIPIFGSNT